MTTDTMTIDARIVVPKLGVTGALRQVVLEYGLASLLDAIGDEFPAYANDLHDIIERVEFEARRLKR